MVSIDKRIERNSSINLSRTSKGLYSWDIKLYFDKEEDNADEVKKEIERLNGELLKSFGGKK